MRLEQSKDNDCSIIWSSYHDNKFCDEQYKAELQKLESEDEYYYKVYTLGEWTPLNVVGQIYKKFIDKPVPDGNIAEYEYNPQLPLIVCCDFNVNPMKWAFIQKLQGNDYVFDELVQYDTYTERMAKEVLSRYGNRSYLIYGDYTGSYRSTKSSKTDYDIIEQILNIDKRIKPNPSIMDRINAVNWRLCNKDGVRRLLITKNCIHTIKDFQRVVFKEGKREEEQITKDGMNELTHISSAIGYYCEYEYSLKGKPYAELFRR